LTAIKADSSLIGEVVEIEGIISALDIKTLDGATLSYIQDLTEHGIALENVSDTLDILSGQKIRVTGTLVEVGGELRIQTEESVLLASRIKSTTPVTVTDLSVVENYAGRYVQVTGKVTNIDDNLVTLDNSYIVEMTAGDIGDISVGDNIKANAIVSMVNNETVLYVYTLDDISFLITDESEDFIVDTIETFKLAGYTDTTGGNTEVVAYNADNSKMYVVNGGSGYLQIIDIANVNDTTYLDLDAIDIDLSLFNIDGFSYGGATSVAVNTKAQIVAVALQDADYTKNGRIAVLDYDGNLIDSFECGVQPDMIIISKDGQYIMTADEGEPQEGLILGEDPRGSVTIVDYSTKVANTIYFDDNSVIDADVHIRDNTKGAEYDLEPEYIAINEAGTKAYVTLQENNSIATIDIATQKVEKVQFLGFKDHSVEGNGLDPIDDGNIKIETLPILGVYMPDGIDTITIDGVDYILTANEGDATEWGKLENAFENIASFGDIADKIELDASLFGGMTQDEADIALEYLKGTEFMNTEVLTDMGTDAIYMLGGRSFAIFRADDMELIYDSGDEFEQIIAQRYPNNFNANSSGITLDARSDKKGAEPESIVVGEVDGTLMAFIALERMGGFMVYDITDPANPVFINYSNSKDYSDTKLGDYAPEGLKFVPAEDSPTGVALLLVANEDSSTVGVHQIGDIVEQTDDESDDNTDSDDNSESDDNTDDETADNVYTDYNFSYATLTSTSGTSSTVTEADEITTIDDEDTAIEAEESITTIINETTIKSTVRIEEIFTDINNSAWYYADVANVYNLGIMTGLTQSEFAPQSTANRATLAVVLHRMSNTPTITSTNTFADVVAGSWYEASVNWAIGNGIYGGFEDGTFRPSDAITREQLVTIMYNFATSEGYTLSGSNIINNFADANEVAAWATPAMQWAVGNGIVNGKDGNTLDPKGTATRAEIATIINRFINNIQ
ncbi:MAG: hypothetical protein ATN34_01190, partial [Epulopiscium sp. Nele67-Bin002]